jgi:hypothetical protein
MYVGDGSPLHKQEGRYHHEEVIYTGANMAPQEYGGST